MANTENRIHMSVYVTPKVKKYIHMEAIRRNTYITHIASEILTMGAKWYKMEEIDRKRKDKDVVGVREAEKELMEIQQTLTEIKKEIKTTQKRS